jgi:hypothetical protein
MPSALNNSKPCESAVQIAKNLPKDLRHDLCNLVHLGCPRCETLLAIPIQTHHVRRNQRGFIRLDGPCGECVREQCKHWELPYVMGMEVTAFVENEDEIRFIYTGKYGTRARRERLFIRGANNTWISGWA